MKKSWMILTAAAVMTVSTVAVAKPITEREKRDCKADYHKFCSKHDLESPGLRACMRQVRFNLSDRCINALVASGEISPKMGEKLKAGK